MSRFTRTLLIFFAAALALAGVAATSSTTEHERLSTFEDGLLVAVNELRVGQGLRPLRIAPGLQAAAVSHSRAMLEGGFFEHSSRDGTPFHERVRQSYPSKGWSSWSVAENLLMNTVEIPVDVAMQAWLDSPPHREIMLMPAWREIGIGALHAPIAGGDWQNGPAWVVTMDFGARTGQKTPATRPAPKARPKPRPTPSAAPAPALPVDTVPDEPYELDPDRILPADDL